MHTKFNIALALGMYISNSGFQAAFSATFGTKKRTCWYEGVNYLARSSHAQRIEYLSTEAIKEAVTGARLKMGFTLVCKKNSREDG